MGARSSTSWCSRALLVVGLFLCQSLFARTYQEVPELAKCFEKENVTGTFVLFDAATDTMFVWNETRAKKRFIPASTFKIANSLIGLDTGAVKNVDEVLPYGGKPQFRKEWEHDMGLRDAIKISNVAVYQELARRIKIDRMREGVRKLQYGNMEIGAVVDRFWLDGPLTISAVEQTEFLRRLTSGIFTDQARGDSRSEGNHPCWKRAMAMSYMPRPAGGSARCHPKSVGGSAGSSERVRPIPSR